MLTGGAASLQKSGSGAAGATSTTPVTGSSIGAPTASAPAASVATTATTATAATTATTSGATPTAAAKSAATPSGGGGTAGASSAGDTASRVADANVSVLEAQNALQVARDALASATLTAPISGTVATIPFIVGGTAGTSNALTIVGTGAVRVTVDVPLASLPKVKVGQNTRVTASGATKPVGGKIESVAILPVSGTTTFPVTVLVGEPAAALASGSSATASIVLSTLTDVVTVPNSALTRTGTETAAVVTVSSG
ncbi:MAG: HlyD family efflux transporter periplasmic adaptor subunit, partial [Mycobacteriaceae bacterium]